MGKDSKDQIVTKGMLDEAVDSLLVGMDKLYQSFKKLFEKELEPIKADITFIKRDTRDIKAELSDTPSRREFKDLKTRVDKYHPILKSA